jgi:hypothetical protein
MFIAQLRKLHVGCVVKSMYLGCLLYADDMILLCPSLRGLQCMLDNCVDTAEVLSLTFNASKSACLAVGKLARIPYEPMLLGTKHIDWVRSMNYLGVTLCGGNVLRFDCNVVRQKFFAACNCIYAHGKQLDEIIHLTLQESYSLPILTYAAASAKYTVKQLDELNACWNSVFRKIFGFHMHESVKSFICGLGRLDLRHIFRIRRVKFYFHILHEGNRCLRDIFWTYLADHFSDDQDLASSVCERVSVNCNAIYANFRLICT